MHHRVFRAGAPAEVRQHRGHVRALQQAHDVLQIRADDLDFVQLLVHLDEQPPQKGDVPQVFESVLQRELPAFRRADPGREQPVGHRLRVQVGELLMRQRRQQLRHEGLILRFQRLLHFCVAAFQRQLDLLLDEMRGLRQPLRQVFRRVDDRCFRRQELLPHLRHHLRAQRVENQPLSTGSGRQVRAQPLHPVHIPPELDVVR